jgi:uncharacterized protein HemX
MGLLPDATSGLYAALIAGIFSVVLWWLNKRNEKPARRDAWQKQAQELRNELRTAYGDRIAYLEGRVTAQDAEIGRKDAEIIRLNKLLNRQRGVHE